MQEKRGMFDKIWGALEPTIPYLVQSASASLTGWRKSGSDSAVPVEGTF